MLHSFFPRTGDWQLGTGQRLPPMVGCPTGVITRRSAFQPASARKSSLIMDHRKVVTSASDASVPGAGAVTTGVSMRLIGHPR
ncbi:hypothetical protein [Streptomyces sp. ME19-01-6]|uniref:hypothetical protein n=1 Tax=Streptomyces sp. ME19-01-6 TaxID=3028686 RepID=UPI0029A38F87|nr:hypothetical protein [Streptomyces sp. ME19-01-6]MDX3231867.1 hypothetical protein [Streptomyces sp. ME19-01-6]